MTEAAAAQALKVFYDTEFIENGVTIELISIGMVTEDGRELYLINSECDWSKASDWVQENVISKLEPTPANFVPHREIRDRVLAFLGWRTRREIAEEEVGHLLTLDYFKDRDLDAHELRRPARKLELWGYYSAYDHVALCQLFGTMMNLPKGMPMYTRDLKQWCAQMGDPPLPEQGKGEHDALADARWNREAHRFLTDHAEQQRRARNAHLWSIATGQGDDVPGRPSIVEQLLKEQRPGLISPQVIHDQQRVNAAMTHPEDLVHIYANSHLNAQRVAKAFEVDLQRCRIYTSPEALAGRDVPYLHLVGPSLSPEVLAQLQWPGRELVYGL